MLENEFYNWLLKKYGKGTAQSRKTNCSTVCRYEGDLDEYFDKDRCSDLMDRLSYTANDERENQKQRHKIPINGNIRNGSATLKQAVGLYVQFKMDKTYINNDIISYTASNGKIKDTSSNSKGNFKTTTVEYKIFKKEKIENLSAFQEVCKIADELLSFFNTQEVLDRILSIHKLNAKSQEIQNIILEKAKILGFTSEKKGLFSKYKTSGLRPDYYCKIANDDGILMEVERGKTLANNMDMLDIWKCHICEEANYLFLIVPKIRQTKDRGNNIVYKKVIDRMESFFHEKNYINVNAVFIFGY